MNSESDILMIVIVVFLIAVVSMVIVVIAGQFRTTVGDTDISQDFGVSNPGINRSCLLRNTPSSIASVRYYNGTAWTTLSTSNYTLTGRRVIVHHDAMD